MFTTYKVLLLVHILAAVIWVGGAFTVQLFAIRTTRAKDSERLAAFASDVEKIGTRTYIPASLVLIITGPWLVAEGNLDWAAWLVIALAIWVITFLSGVLYIGPTSAKIARTVAAEGAASPNAARLIRGIFLHSRGELVLLFIAIAVMVLKPGA